MPIAYMTVGALCALFLYRLGYRDGQGKDTPKAPPITLFKRKHKVDPEIAKIETVLQNIDTYDGTGRGQKPIG